MKRYPWLLSILLVNPDGSGPYPTIQSAIDAAVNGDEVYLTSGTFTGPGNYDVNLQGKTITVRGQEDYYPWIMPGSGHQAFTCESGEGPETIIGYLTLVAGGSDLGTVRVVGSSPTIRNCLFSSNTGSCIYTQEGSPLIQSCAFTECSSFANATCINSIGGYIQIKDCSFAQNYSQSGGVVSIESGYILDCNLYYNSLDLTVAPGGADCVYIVNTSYESLQVLPGACVRIRTEKHAHDFAPLSLSPESWGAIKVKYR